MRPIVMFGDPTTQKSHSIDPFIGLLLINGRWQTRPRWESQKFSQKYDRSIPHFIEGFDRPPRYFCNDPTTSGLLLSCQKYSNFYHLEYSPINGSFPTIGQSVRKCVKIIKVLFLKVPKLLKILDISKTWFKVLNDWELHQPYTILALDMQWMNLKLFRLWSMVLMANVVGFAPEASKARGGKGRGEAASSNHRVFASSCRDLSAITAAPYNYQPTKIRFSRLEMHCIDETEYNCSLQHPSYKS